MIQADDAITNQSLLDNCNEHLSSLPLFATFFSNMWDLFSSFVCMLFFFSSLYFLSPRFAQIFSFCYIYLHNTNLFFVPAFFFPPHDFPSFVVHVLLPTQLFCFTTSVHTRITRIQFAILSHYYYYYSTLFSCSFLLSYMPSFVVVIVVVFFCYLSFVFFVLFFFSFFFL